jgi:prephenate dehydratase
MSARVGYPGPTGSHSGAASVLLAPSGAATAPLASFVAVVEATVAGAVSLGVLPIENSLHGPVGETHDLLYEAPVSIVSEVTLPIVHCLAVKGALRLEEVRVLRSHPVAFDQCRDLVGSLEAKCVPSASTSDAALEVAESETPGEAALSSREAAEHYGLTVIADDVGDRPAAFTRFVGIASYTLLDRAPRSRMALSLVTDHRPGSLYHALGPFHRHGLNLVQLVSRPIPRSTFRYRFDMVLDAHPLDPEVRLALAELREWTREVRIFGSYAAAGVEQ